ncbi:hypothetical protein [Winogradskyella sp.]|uniref:hypothetical protein n=1 Tax=Winogradskyella sp. TaxID=1883156 RepID=UPI00262C0B76|nr:hypothetical protein [Winogradskyella sp.]
MNKLVSKIIQCSVFLIFIGRAYQFLFFGSPFRELLWDESLMTPLIEGLFKIPWNEYASDLRVNSWIELSTKLSAVVFILSAVLAIFWFKISFSKLKRSILGIGVVILIFTGICIVKSKNYDILQFFELAIQITAPVILLFSEKLLSKTNTSLMAVLKIAIVLVFISHGLFAMGVMPVPGYFIDMTIGILGFDETKARQFLFIVGFLDVLASIGIFFSRTAPFAFFYLIIWGTVTALARFFIGLAFSPLEYAAHHNLYLTIYRLPHGLLPIAAYLLLEQFKTETNKIELT